MDPRPPSTSAAASTASSTSASSPALDSAARRSCTKCSRRMSSYDHDKHSLCLHCRYVLCSVDTRCRECSSWSTDEMLEYLKHIKSLVSKGKKRSNVAMLTSASPSVLPSVTPVSVSAIKVASSASSLPSLASEEGLKTFVHSVLASFLSQPSSSLGTNPFLPAPSAEVPDVSRSRSAGGSEGNNLMKGRPVAPSGMVPPPIEEDVISPPNVSVHVSVACGTVSSMDGVGALGLPNPSLGQFSDPYRQDLGQSHARGAPGFGLLHDAFSRDVHNVAPSLSNSFNPLSLLFPLFDSGFASLPSSVPFLSSPAFSLPLSYSSSASSFSSLAPSAPLPLFTLPSVVPSVISLSSSSSVPSFPLPQFSNPVYPSSAPPSLSAPLPSFSALPFSSTPVHPPPGFSTHPSFPQAQLSSLPVASTPTVSAVSSALSLFRGCSSGVSLTPSAPLLLFTLPSVVPSVISLSSSSSVPSFPLPQFSNPFYPSASPPSLSAPLPSFSAPPFSSTPVHPPPGFSAHPSFPQAPLSSLPVASTPTVSAVSSAPSLSSGGAPPGYPPVSTLSSPSLSLSSSSSSPPVGDLADFQARELGLSAEYQALGRWFVASGGSDFLSYRASYCSHLYSDFRTDFASGSSRFLAALSSSASSFFFVSFFCLFTLCSFSATGGSGSCLFFACSFCSSLSLPCTFADPSLFFSSCFFSSLSASSGVFFSFAFPSRLACGSGGFFGCSGVGCGSCFASCPSSCFSSFSFSSFRCESCAFSAGTSSSPLFCFPFRSFGF